MKALVILVVVIVFFVLALAIGAQNDQLVSIHYLVASSDLRVSWLMAIMFIIGFVVACLGLGFFYTKTRLQLMSLRRKLRKQQRELEQAKSIQSGD